MKLYHFPSPNPQKVRFAPFELGPECEIVSVDLTKGEHRTPEFLALNPNARVPVLRDGSLILWESHAILAYLGEKTGRMWPRSAEGRADALRWLFFLSGHISPPAVDLVYNRIVAKVVGASADQDAIARGEKALPVVIRILEGQLANGKWLLGDDFTLVECAYGPALHVIEKRASASRRSRRCARIIWTRSARVPHGRKLPSFRDFRRDSNDRGGLYCRF